MSRPVHTSAHGRSIKAVSESGSRIRSQVEWPSLASIFSRAEQRASTPALSRGPAFPVLLRGGLIPAIFYAALHAAGFYAALHAAGVAIHAAPARRGAGS